MADRASNPYVGPRAFEERDHDVFFGRDEETRQLADLVVAYRAVLLYAESGAGKTSLLNAGLVPQLRGHKGIVILPIGRVSGDMTLMMQMTGVRNQYVSNVLFSIFREDVKPKELVDLSLSDALKKCFSEVEEPSLPHLLVLDQFEELFAVNGGRDEERDRVVFLNELQTCLTDHPQLGLLLSMREDYIAHLDPYAAQLPDRLRIRFRLELLDRRAALEAIQEPARRSGIPFAPPAAASLVDDLRRVQFQTLDGRREEQLGLYVSPLQLQIVCYRLWNQLPPEVREITRRYVDALGNVDRALMTYYDEQVVSAARAIRMDERFVREWVDDELITEDGFRKQTSKIHGRGSLPANLIIDRFVAAHLMRPERRHGVTWYELAHDRLVRPIQNSNAMQKHRLGNLRHRVKKWQAYRDSSGLLQRLIASLRLALDGHRNQGFSRLLELPTPRDLLLSGKQLDSVEQWSKRYPDSLSPEEKEFLRASQDREKAIEEVNRFYKNFMLTLILFFIVVLLSYTIQKLFQ